MTAPILPTTARSTLSEKATSTIRSTPAGATVLTATVSIAVGFLAAQLFLHAQLDQTLVAPDPQYYLIVALGLLAALAILASTLPMFVADHGSGGGPLRLTGGVRRTLRRVERMRS